MTTLDQALAGARRLAKSAAIRDLGTRSCPYDPEGPPVERAARREFYAEYLRRRPMLTRGPVVDDLDYLAYGDQDDEPAAAAAGGTGEA